MGAILSYSLAASFLIMVLYPVLSLIIGRSTSFRFNRVAVLGGMMLSLSVPLLLTGDLMPSVPDNAIWENSVLGEISDSISDRAVEIPADNPSPADRGKFPWIAVALIVYSAGTVILLGREIVSYIRLFRMISKSDKSFHDGHVICRLNEPRMAPFSWGRYIFINDLELEDSFNSIYLHEKAHTDRRHWIDVLFADIFCILLWYNPFAWMTRQLMKLNHEFEADSAVIASGVDTCDYQHLLVLKAMGYSAISVTNSIAAGKRNFRKRVLIMSRKRSSKKIRLIALFAIPAVIIAGSAIASPAFAGFIAPISDYKFENPEIKDQDEIAGSIGNGEDSGILENESLQNASMSNNDDISTATVAEADNLIELPSPFEDQTALAEIISLSMETVESDRDAKVNIEIVVGEDGRVKEVLTNIPEGELLAKAISKKFEGYRFEQMTENGRPIEVRFNVPVQMKIQD